MVVDDAGRVARIVSDERELEKQARARRASDLMRTDVATARDDQLVDAIGPMVTSTQRMVAVVDREGRFVGALDRSDVLRGLVQETP